MLSFLGSWALFWLSFTGLLLGLTHDWFALPAEDVTPVVALFLISWLVVIAGLTVFTLRLPRRPPRSSRWWPSRWPWCWPRH
jgi:succinate-acetate transporter protein